MGLDDVNTAVAAELLTATRAADQMRMADEFLAASAGITSRAA